MKIPNLVTRVQWRASPQASPVARGQIWPSRLGVVLHWEGPHMGATAHNFCDDAVRGIQRYHIISRKWLDIAYTYVVCRHGHVYEGRGVGRRTAANGTTVANDGAYAVCALVGEGDTLTTSLLIGLRDTVEALWDSGARRRVTGHRAHFATECPGADLTRWMAGGMKVPGRPPVRAARPSRAKTKTEAR